MKHGSYSCWIAAILALVLVRSAGGQEVKDKPYWTQLPRDVKVLDTVLFGTAPERKASMAAHKTVGSGNSPRDDRIGYSSVNLEWTMDPKAAAGPYVLFVVCTDYYTVYSGDWRPYAKMALYVQDPKTKKFKRLRAFFYDCFNRGKGYLIEGKGPFRFRVGKASGGGFTVSEARLIQRIVPTPRDEPTWLRDITYTYDEPPNLNADPDNTLLTDGRLGSHNVCAFYSRGITPRVTFDLRDRHLIDRVEVYVHPSNGCGIGHVEVEVEEDGRFVVAARSPKGHEAGRKPAPDWPGFVAATGINRQARRVRVNTGYSGGNTMIKEIRIFGKKLASARFPGKEPMSIAMVPGYKAPGPQKGLRVVEADLNGDGSNEVLLENDYVRAIVEPACGGVVGSFLHKATGTDFTTAVIAGAGRGIFADHLWTADSAAYDGDYYNKPYTIDIHQQQDRVGVTLSRTGTKSYKQFITCHKTFWLTRDSSVLRADYALDCDLRTVTGITCGLWTHNFFGAPKDRAVTFFWPLSSGIETGAPAQYDEKWMPSPSRGWAAAVVDKGKAGAAFVVGYAHLQQFHTWGYAGIPYPTLEWRTNQIAMPAGGRFETTARLVPFGGLAEVAGASAAGAASLTITPKDGLKANVCLVAARPIKGTLVLQSRFLPEGNWATLDTKDIFLATDKALDHHVRLKPIKPGTYVVRGELKDTAGRVLLSFEKPYTLGKASARYALKPRVANARTSDTAAAEINTNFNRLTFSTPHVKWAKPFAGKPVRALMLLHRYHQVEAAALAQRMDLEFDAPFYSEYYPRESLGDYYGRVTEPIMHEEIKRFLRKDYDVYVISSIMWRKLDDKDRETILKRVNAGAGLIALEPFPDKPAAKDAKKTPRPSPWWETLPFKNLIAKGQKYYGFRGRMRPVARHALSVGIPYRAVPPMSYSRYAPSGTVLVAVGKDPILATGTYAKGRVLALSWRVQGAAYAWTEGGLIPWLNGVTKGEYRFPYWEYNYAWLAKCLIYAAGQDMPLELVDIKPTQEKIAHADLPQNAVEVTVKRASYTGKVTAEVTLMDRFGRRGKPVRAEVAWQGQSGTARFPLSHLSGRTHLADVILRDASGKTLNWGSTSFEVIPVAYIPAIDADSKKFYQRSDTARVWAKVAGDAAVLKTATMAVLFEDSYGRLLKSETYNVGAEANAQKWCELPLADMVTSGLTARAVLRDAAGNVLDEERREFTVGMPRFWDDFSFRMWDSRLATDTPDNITLLRMRLLKQVGVDAINWHGWMSCPGLYDALKASGMRIFSGGGGIGSRAYNSDISSKKYRDYMGKLCEQRAQSLGPYGSYGVIGGDENSYGVGDWKKKPAMVAGFRDWLHKEYGTLAALNAEWGSAYKTWEQIVPLSLKELPAKDNFAPVSDLWRWNELEFTAITRLQMDSTHKGNPKMRFGLSGTQRATAGSYDWWLLSRAMDMNHGYGGVQVLQRRSFNPDLKEHLYISPAGHGDRRHRRVWGIVLDGGLGPISCGNLLVQPDYSLFKGALDLARDIAILRSGVGKIIINAKRRWDPVAIHYSQRSVHATTILGPYKSMVSACTNIQNILHELGLQPRYLSYEQIADGELVKAKYRIMFMPYSYAVSKQEAKAIREWVQRGGVVFALVGAGAMDGHCRVLEKGMFDDLFGIQRGQFAVATGDHHAEGQRDTEGIMVKGMTIPCSVCESNIKAEGGATVLATIKETGVPAIIVRRCGKGLAVYCAGNIFGTYTRDRGIRSVRAVKPVIDGLERLVESALKRAGVAADTAVKDAQGQRIPSFVTYQYEYGGASYVGFIGSSRVKTFFHLGAKGYVTEMLTGKSFGHTDKVTYPVGTASVSLFSILPYKVTGIAIDAPARVVQGERLEARLGVSRLDIRSPMKGMGQQRHVLHVELINPAGKVVDYYSQNLVTDRHKAVFTGRLALNEAPGPWTLRVKDAATGTVSSKPFAVVEIHR